MAVAVAGREPCPPRRRGRPRLCLNLTQVAQVPGYHRPVHIHCCTIGIVSISARVQCNRGEYPSRRLSGKEVAGHRMALADVPQSGPDPCPTPLFFGILQHSSWSDCGGCRNCWLKPRLSHALDRAASQFPCDRCGVRLEQQLHARHFDF